MGPTIDIRLIANITHNKEESKGHIHRDLWTRLQTQKKGTCTIDLNYNILAIKHGANTSHKFGVNTNTYNIQAYGNSGTKIKLLSSTTNEPPQETTSLKKCKNSKRLLKYNI